MQKVNNMGSLLQAYGLKKMLEKIGCTVEYIDIKKNDEDYKLLGNFTQEFIDEFEKKGIKGRFSKIDNYIVNRIRHRKLEKRQNKIFEKFRRRELNISKTSDNYDICIIGSDEVFNCLNAGTWGFTSQLFGNVPEAKRIITYAASCGATKYEDLPHTIKKRIQEAFSGVEAFSVRDSNTADFVRSLAHISPSENFDPVLIWDYTREIKSTDTLKLKKPYCIVYSYRNRIHNKIEINKIVNFSKRHSLKLIALGAPQFWIKDYIVCTPFECLELFKNASFVITDTFHGTIFSAKYTTRFAVIIRDSNLNKQSDLIRRLDIEAHLVQSMDDLDYIYLLDKDKNAFDQIIEKEQEKSYKYLKESIE